MRQTGETALAFLFVFAALAAPVWSAQPLVGRIVQLSAPGNVLLLHEAGDGMPAMAMPFRLDRATFSKLLPGMKISAVADRSTQPATLRSLRIEGRAAEPARYVPTLQAGDAIPAFGLIDQRGRPFALSDYLGRAVVLSFIYTRCNDRAMCPLLSAKFAQLQRRLAREPVHLVEVTLDPAYDTPRVLARYAKAFAADDRRWTFATGQATAGLAARAGIVTAQTPRGIVHSEAVVILDRNGRVWRIIDDNAWTATELAAEVRASLGDVPDPLSRLRLWLESGVAAVCGGASGVSTASALAIFFVLSVAGGALVRRLFYSGTQRR